MKSNATKIKSSDNLNGVYNIGEKVVHIPEGVCTITEITKMAHSGVEKDYYKLVPVMDNSTAIYVSLNTSEKNIRKLRSKNELLHILEAQKKTKTHWEKNEEKRISQMKSAIHKDDGVAIAKLIKTYYQKRKQERLCTSDNNMLKKAEQLLYSEMAEVLKTDYSNLRSKIFE